MKAMERLADGILLGAGAALALILIFLVSVHGMALHYALVGVVALGLFATRWLNASVKINLAFVVLSSLLAVYACELVLAVGGFWPCELRGDAVAHISERSHSGIGPGAAGEEFQRQSDVRPPR